MTLSCLTICYSPVPVCVADYVAGAIVTAIKRNTALLCLPRMVYASSILKGVLPVPVLDWASEVLGISESMDDFKGRQVAGAGGLGRAATAASSVVCDAHTEAGAELTSSGNSSSYARAARVRTFLRAYRGHVRVGLSRHARDRAGVMHSKL